jgi:CRP/FNR family transcriptional regulator, global nitrogen regulator
LVLTTDHRLGVLFQKLESGQAPPVVEHYDRGKTIFFPGDPAERVYFLVKGAVKLSRVFDNGEEITVSLLRENSVFGVLSIITGHRSDRFYHAVAITPVELLAANIDQVEKALRNDAELSSILLKGLASRILQTEMMIETLAHRDMGSRLESFILILCRDFGVPGRDGITIDLRLSHQAIAEAIGSTRVTITRLLGELKKKNLISIHKKKITVRDPVQLGQRFT